MEDERNLTIEYLEEMKEKYIEGEGYERHPLPEWYALDKAIKALEQEPSEDAVIDGSVPVVREELKEIEKILQKNGWVQAAPTQPDEMTEFVKNTADGDVVGIEIALEKTSLPCYGRYGIGCIQIVKYSQPAPYIRDDLRNMEKIILDAEKELLTIGVPFRPTYGFGFALENNLDRNLDLREKYNLDQFEKEDWR